MKRPDPNRTRERRSLAPLSILLALVVCGCGRSIHDAAAMADLATATAWLDRDPSLVESTNELGKTPLHMAVTSGSSEMVQLLLDRGAEVNAHDRTGLTPLHVAAWWTATNRAQQLLDAGANPDALDHFGDTPLHVAAMQGRQAMTAFLARHGANLTIENLDGRTPLALAGVHGQEKTVHLLEVLELQAAAGDI
ncbi:MAG: hypothetical protein AMXMBFR82_00190 [Candidatus Hydrogenedentota bacterium]